MVRVTKQVMEKYPEAGFLSAKGKDVMPAFIISVSNRKQQEDLQKWGCDFVQNYSKRESVYE